MPCRAARARMLERRMSRPLSIARLGACLVLALVAVAAAAADATAAAPVANPTVSGPVSGGLRGCPWNKSLYSLRGKGFDYTEKEYFFGGSAKNLASGA